MTTDFRPSLASAHHPPPVRSSFRRGVMEPVMILTLLLIVWIGLQALKWVGRTL